MSLGSATIAAAGQTVLKFAAGLGLLKVLALYLGPAGLALFGQVQSSFILMGGLAALFASNGLTALLVAHSGEPEAEQRVIGTAMALSTGIGVACALALPVLNELLGARLFGTPLPWWLVAMLCLGVVLQATGMLLIAIFTARGAMKTYGVLTSIAPMLLFAFSLGVVPLAGFKGAAASIALAAICAGGVAVATAHARRTVRWRSVRWSLNAARPLIRFGVLGLISLIATPLSQILIRQMLSSHLSPEVAGTWHAAMRLSEAILAPVVTLFTIYVLPRQAAATDAEARRSAWLTTARLLPVGIVVACVLFLCRRAIVVTLFSEKFLGMTAYIQIQFAGDVARVLGWVFAYTLIARGFALRLAALECLYAVSWPAACLWWVKHGDVAAASKSYLLGNLLYLSLGALLTHRSLRTSRASSSGRYVSLPASETP